MRPGRIGEALPGDVRAQLLHRDLAAGGAFNGWAAVGRDAAGPADHRWRLDPEHASDRSGTAKVLDKRRHARIVRYTYRLRQGDPYCAPGRLAL